MERSYTGQPPFDPSSRGPQLEIVYKLPHGRTDGVDNVVRGKPFTLVLRVGSRWLSERGVVVPAGVVRAVRAAVVQLVDVPVAEGEPIPTATTCPHPKCPAGGGKGRIVKVMGGIECGDVVTSSDVCEFTFGDCRINCSSSKLHFHSRIAIRVTIAGVSASTAPFRTIAKPSHRCMDASVSNTTSNETIKMESALEPTTAVEPKRETVVPTMLPADGQLVVSAPYAQFAYGAQHTTPPISAPRVMFGFLVPHITVRVCRTLYTTDEVNKMYEWLYRTFMNPEITSYRMMIQEEPGGRSRIVTSITAALRRESTQELMNVLKQSFTYNINRGLTTLLIDGEY